MSCVGCQCTYRLRLPSCLHLLDVQAGVDSTILVSNENGTQPLGRAAIVVIVVRKKVAAKSQVYDIRRVAPIRPVKITWRRL